MYFNVKDGNAMALKYFDLRTSAVWQFKKSEYLPEDGQVRPKHVVVDCDFNVILKKGETVETVALKTEINEK
jgi:hypothetical protein